MSLERSGENVIEWLTSEKKALLTFNQQKHVNLLTKLAEKYPDDVDVEINADGSVFGHVPVSWIRIYPPRIMSDEQRERLANQLASLKRVQNSL